MRWGVTALHHLKSCRLGDRDRQCELKACARPGVVNSPQPATMRFDDRAADGQPHAGTMGLGGEERREDLVRRVHGETGARIVDRNQELPLVAWFRIER